MTTSSDTAQKKVLSNRYNFLKVLTRTSLGTIHQAYDQMTTDSVVITSLMKEKIESIGKKYKYTLGQCQNDVSFAAKISHPNSINIIDITEDNECYYVISELTNFTQLFQSPDVLAKENIFSIISAFEKIVNFLQHQNHIGIFGCCLRESNIYISSTGDIKVDNLFSCRHLLISDLHSLKSKITGLVVGPGGAFVDRESNIRLDLYFLSGILDQMLLLAKKKQQESVKIGQPFNAIQADLSQSIFQQVGKMAVKFDIEENSPKSAYKTIDDVAIDLRLITDEIRLKTGAAKPKRTNLRQLEFFPGDTIFKEADSSRDSAFIIESGTVQILKSDPDGKEILLAITQPGDVIGEMAIIDHLPRMATARSLEYCVVGVVSAMDFEAMIGKMDKVPQMLIRMLTRRLRRQSEGITQGRRRDDVPT